LAEVFQITKAAATMHLTRLEKRMMIKRIKRGVYKKIVY
jgi:DNA-binding MarR family transcriptional regulator